jgi:hypothetical protein
VGIYADWVSRFTLKRSDLRGLQAFALHYRLWPWNLWTDFTESWCSQAHGIFDQLGIEEDERSEYCGLHCGTSRATATNKIIGILFSFYLRFELVEEHESSHTCTDVPEETPIYLFIRPIPRPCDSDEKWHSWLREALYYWSFDSSGVEAMPEQERLNLGLPKFTTKIETVHDWWDWDTYDALEMIHLSRGFDPTSTELATSLGHTILEVVDRKSPFR